MGIDIGKRVKVCAAHSFWYDREGTVIDYDKNFRTWTVKLDPSGDSDNNDMQMGVQFGELEIELVGNPTEQYDKMEIAPFDVVETWPLEQRVGAYRFGIVKHIAEMDVKDDRLKQVEKALYCCVRLVATLKRG